jgi:hypothetical protein
VTELRLYDVVHSIGVATDLNHIDTPAKVTGYLPADNGLEKALTNAELVIIPAGQLFAVVLSFKHHTEYVRYCAKARHDTRR